MSCSYQGTNHPQLLRLVQFYITNGFELLKQVNTRNPSVAISLLNYAWNHRDRQAILDMLFAAILGVGVYSSGRFSLLISHRLLKIYLFFNC